MPTDQTIIAYFSSGATAQDASRALSASGFTDVHIKRNRRAAVTVEDPSTPSFIGMDMSSDLTMFSTNGIDTAVSRILVGSDPVISHTGVEGYGLPGSSAYSVVAFVPEARSDEAIRLLKEYGGEM